MIKIKETYICLDSELFVNMTENIYSQIRQIIRDLSIEAIALMILRV